MMKSLYPELPWDSIKAIGFDMDGTLYDEFDFIKQVYNVIAQKFAQDITNTHHIYNFMLSKWLEKGSSYPFIFSETLEHFGIEKNQHSAFIEDALSIFRNYNPILTLSPRVEFLLKAVQNNYTLFLVSDGSSTLQWNKFNALQLNRFFKKDHVFISGDYGKEAQKPSLVALDKLPFLKQSFAPTEVVFIGDRAKDRDFAMKANFHFITVKHIFVNQSIQEL